MAQSTSSQRLGPAAHQLGVQASSQTPSQITASSATESTGVENSPPKQDHQRSLSSPSSAAGSKSSAKKRVRTGCLNCRRKHKKCDETKPICKTCQLKNEECEWPTAKLKKSNSRRSSLSIPKNGYSAYTTTAPLDPGVSAVTSYLQPGASANTMGYPLYNSRPVTNQAALNAVNPIVKKPKLENSPMEHLSVLPPGAGHHQHQIHQQDQRLFRNQPPAIQQHAPTTLHPISPFASTGNDSQVPRRTSTDLSSYSLGRAINTPPSQQHVPFSSQAANPNRSQVFTPQQRHQQPPHFPNQPPSSAGDEQFPKPRLNLNNLLNSQGPFEPQQLPQSSIRNQGMSVDSSLISETNHSSARSSMKNGELTPMTNLSTKSSISLDLPSFKNLNSFLENFLTSGRISDQKFPYTELSASEQASLIHHFITNVAPKLNIIDSDFWSIFVPVLSKSSHLVRFSIYAAALFDMKNYEKGMKLYAMTLNYISEERGKLTLFISLTLLTLVTTLVLDHKDWKVTVKKLAAFIDTNSIYDSAWATKGQGSDCLWWCVLKEINTLDIGEESTAFSKETLQAYTFGNEIPQIISILSQTCNLIGAADNTNFDAEWENLWTQVHVWSINKNITKPLIDFETNDYDTFPVLVYNSGPAALASQLFHTTVILLSQNKPRLFKIDKSIKPVTYHAKHIVGSSLNNDFLESWNNANQCLWNAGKIFTHQDEHNIVLGLIANIQEKTGQISKYKVEDFREYWRNS